MWRVWTKPRITQTTKDLKFGVVWLRSKEFCIWRGKVKNWSWYAINEIESSDKCI